MALTRAQLLALIASDLPDNSVGAITPAILRNVLNQMVDNVGVPIDVTFTTTPSTIAATAGNVYFNVATAAVGILPDAAAWATANPGGLLFLKDKSGAAATNNITINRAGSNTIDGLTTFDITSNYGEFTLKVVAGNWTFAG